MNFAHERDLISLLERGRARPTTNDGQNLASGLSPTSSTVSRSRGGRPWAVWCGWAVISQQLQRDLLNPGQVITVNGSRFESWKISIPEHLHSYSLSTEQILPPWHSRGKIDTDILAPAPRRWRCDDFPGLVPCQWAPMAVRSREWDAARRAEIVSIFFLRAAAAATGASGSPFGQVRALGPPVTPAPGSPCVRMELRAHEPAITSSWRSLTFAKCPGVRAQGWAGPRVAGFAWLPWQPAAPVTHQWRPNLLFELNIHLFLFWVEIRQSSVQLDIFNIPALVKMVPSLE